MKLLFFMLLALNFSVPALAETIVARCGGAKLPNGTALTFEYVRGAPGFGTPRTEIRVYGQDTTTPGAPVKPLGVEPCDSERTEGSKIICNSAFSETYTLDSKTKSAVEAGDGYSARYKCVFLPPVQSSNF